MNTTKPHSNEEVTSEKITTIIMQAIAPYHKPYKYLGEKSIETAKKEIIAILLAQRDAEMLQRVGMLRQWLNEDRITDAKRMVSNAELLVWLTPPDQTDTNPTN